MIPKELLEALRRIEITTNRLATNQLSGEYHSVFRGQGLAFREVRPYQPGDDVRSIDWNVTARMDEAYVKVFVEERETTVMLVVDISRSEQFGTANSTKARLAAEVGALLAFSAIKNNDRVGLVLASDHVENIVPPKKGQKHVMRVISEILTTVPKQAGTDLGVALQTVYRLSRKRTISFLISDFFAEDYERALALAAARHDVVPILLADPRDEQLPNVGLATFEDLESGEDVLVDTADPRVRAHYAQQVKAQRQRTIKTFRRLGLDHCVVRTDAPYVKPLRDLFAARARRMSR